MKSILPKLSLPAGIFVSLTCGLSAAAQPANVPDFWAGDAGWVHVRDFIFPQVPGSPSPVVQDPAHPFGRNSWRLGDVSNPNLKPWVKAAMRQDNDEIAHGKLEFQARSSCLPSGIPNLFVPGNSLLILQTPKEVLFIKEGGQEVRHVYLDVPHSQNLKPSWYGEAVGHYEGDTLVIDTIGQNTKTVVDAFRTPHTEKLHVTERWRLTDGGKILETKFTVEDPDTFNQPWSTVMRQRRGTEAFYEDICQENNQNLFDYHMPVAKTADF